MRFAYFVLTAICCLAAPAQAAGDRFALQSDLDHVWTMTAAGLVFMMQAGFLFLEAGSVRSKNSVNVAHKNLLDFVLSTFCFGLLGFSIMFGDSVSGLFGYSPDLALFGFEGQWTYTFFVFQMMFCGTAATIVSAAVAERAAMTGYIILTILISLFIYPVVGHWAWGDILSGQDKSWLASMGFMDFAGSTVVHGTGAWVALAAVILIGPRTGRFDENGHPIRMHGHSPILATFGCLLLWIGWIGFNGGSKTAGTAEFGRIIANTMAAGAAGAILQSVLGVARSGGLHRPEWLINGSLAGLVAVTAGCAYVSLQMAVLIGLAGAFVAYFMARVVVWFGIDDPISAISVHGFAGVTGTILIAFCAEPEALLAGSRFDQAVVQAIGVGATFVYAFGVAFCLLFVANKLLPSSGGPGRGLRVSVKDETDGLNVSEHDAPLGNTGLVRAMRDIIEKPDAKFEPVIIEPGEESYEASVLFNQIAERIQDKAETEKRLAAQQREMMQSASNQILSDLSTTMQAVMEGRLSQRMDAVEDGPFAAIPRDINAMIDGLDNLVRQIATTNTGVNNTARDLLEQSAELAQTQRKQSDALTDAASKIVDLREQSTISAGHLKDALENADVVTTRVGTSAVASQTALSLLQASASSFEEIYTAVEQIEEIAFQTRLLSLNASVEAARAQGAARVAGGFATVANAVRDLADSTASLALNIRRIVESVRESTEKAVVGVQETDDALKLAQEGIAFNGKIMTTIAEIEQQARRAMVSLEQKLIDLSEVSNQTCETADQTKVIAEGLDGSVREVRSVLSMFTEEETTRSAA